MQIYKFSSLIYVTTNYVSGRDDSMICTCVRCGKQFEVVHKTAVCEDCKTSVCVICGKEFKLNWPYTAKTCSLNCRVKLNQMNGVYSKASKIGNAKIKASEPHLFHKVCKYCGKEFDTYSNRQVYCGDDYTTCCICGKSIKVTDYSNTEGKTCSKECSQIKRERTCLEKYGDSCVVNSEYGVQKRKETCLEKYGVDHYSKTDEYKSKYTNTVRERFGTDYPLQNEDVKAKQIATNVERYGGNSPMCNQDVKNKAQDTVNKHFGGSGLASTELAEKIRSTLLSKYGVDNPLKSDIFKDKVRETCRERYGYDNWLKSRDRILSVMNDPSKIDEYMSFIDNPELYIRTHYDSPPTTVELGEQLGIQCVYDLLERIDCKGLVKYHSSSIESQVTRFLKSIIHDVEIEFNSRSLISPYEIDIYLPEYRFGIECNPTITHNSTRQDPWGGIKSYRYHYDKSMLAIQNNIFLFHIFGYEWSTKRNIICSMLRNILGKSDRRIYARNTTVKEVSSKDAHLFLVNNHRQGPIGSSVRLGLYSEQGELVSLMTFNKARTTISKNADEWELGRFCNLVDTSVVGGASKLFKHFITEYSPNKIVSYSDVAHTRGNLYQVLGFNMVDYSGPGYVWVNYDTDEYKSRVACQKHNIQKMFNLSDDELKNKTEVQIMSEHGYVQVFDSGVIRWEYES